MRKVAVLAALVITGVLAVGTVAIANDDDGSGRNGGRLNGYQEVTSISTTGFGSFHWKLNKDEESIDYVLSYRDLESAVTQAHIHFAQRAQNGGIVVWLCDGDPAAPPTPPAPPARTPPVCPPASGGSVEGTVSRDDVLAAGRGISAGEWEEFVAALVVGHTYANVHTTGWPGGEIRAQLNDRDQKEYTGPPLFAD
jgi:CHRD domain